MLNLIKDNLSLKISMLIIADLISEDILAASRGSSNFNLPIKASKAVSLKPGTLNVLSSKFLTSDFVKRSSRISSNLIII